MHAARRASTVGAGNKRNVERVGALYGVRSEPQQCSVSRGHARVFPRHARTPDRTWCCLKAILEAAKKGRAKQRKLPSTVDRWMRASLHKVPGPNQSSLQGSLRCSEAGAAASGPARNPTVLPSTHEWGREREKVGEGALRAGVD